VAAGNVPNGETHRQDRQAKGQRHAHKSDAKVGESGGQNGGAAASEYQPESAE
jgi:hypothetical protein